MMTGQPLITPPETFKTDRLVLRQPRLSDTDDIFDNYASDPEVTRFVTWRPYHDRTEVLPFLKSRFPMGFW
jgi:ribosomal-protein-alanine N-acetyltransferase